jgi:hypothetical protein
MTRRHLLIAGPLCAGALLATALSAACFAQAPWPTSQSSFRHGLATTAEQARLPDGVVIKPPGPQSPAGIAAMSGVWSGSMGRNRTVSVKVAVEAVHGSGAVVTYAAFGNFGHYAERLSMLWDETHKELHTLFPGGRAHLYLRPREDANLDILFLEQSMWMSGVLIRSEQPRLPTFTTAGSAGNLRSVTSAPRDASVVDMTGSTLYVLLSALAYRPYVACPHPPRLAGEHPFCVHSAASCWLAAGLNWLSAGRNWLPTGSNWS